MRSNVSALREAEIKAMARNVSLIVCTEVSIDLISQAQVASAELELKEAEQRETVAHIMMIFQFIDTLLLTEQEKAGEA